MNSSNAAAGRSRRTILAGLAGLPLLASCAPSVMPAGPARRLPALDERQFTAADGTILPVRHWAAAGGGPPRATILGLHGFGDYSAAFEAPAAIWAEAGIETWAFDQRGFGGSPQHGIWAGAPTMVADLCTVAGLLRARAPGRKLIAVGESMGAALLIATLGSPQGRDLAIDGAALAAPAARTRRSMGPVAAQALDVIAHMVPWLPVGPSSIDFRPTDNLEMLKKLGRDPLIVRNPRTDLVYGLVELMDAAWDAAPDVKRPLLVLYGNGDGVVPRGPTRSLLKRLPAEPPPRLALYDKGFHMLFRDLQGEVPTRDVAAWVRDPKARLPSGADMEMSVLDRAE